MSAQVSGEFLPPFESDPIATWLDPLSEFTIVPEGGYDWYDETVPSLWAGTVGMLGTILDYPSVDFVW